MISAMREVMALSEKEGINLTEDDLSYCLSVLSKLSPEGKPSMRQDMEAKRYSEVELFSGTVLKLGKKYDIPTPVNEELHNKIKLTESKY
jgi:2-dehydropantoate 2-reductase